jgi:hypothetical protein
MLALTLSSLKDATFHLFTQPTFDCFDVLTVTISSYITFSMDGHLNAAFFENSEDSEDSDAHEPDKLCSWQRLRPICFSIIKGKQPPVSFQITLFLDRDKAVSLFSDDLLSQNQDIDGFTLHLSYRNRTLTLSTGTVFARFSLDRDSERLWDQYILAWAKKQQLSFEEV